MADKTHVEIDAQKLFLLQDLLSSSSSEDDEIFVSMNVSKRIVPKIQNAIQAGNEFDDEEFRKLFRMKKTTASILIEDYKTSTFYAHHTTWLRGKPIINAEIHFSIFLWFATNKSPIRCVTQLFDVSLSTAFGIIEKVMNYLVDVAPKYIRFPVTSQEQEKMSSNFKKVSGFPGVLGCVDQTSIPIVTPSHHMKSSYVNRHDITALTLQGICDDTKCFIDVFTCPPGQVRDSGVFKSSNIFQKLPNICDHTYHILGGNAYPLREWCVTPYRDHKKITESQKIFNKKLHQTRVVIKDAFDLLKSRFRQLLKLHFHRIEKVTKFILACCVLHNLCILQNDVLLEEELIVEEMQFCQRSTEAESEHHLRRSGRIKRDILANKF